MTEQEAQLKGAQAALDAAKRQRARLAKYRGSAAETITRPHTPDNTINGHRECSKACTVQTDHVAAIEENRDRELEMWDRIVERWSKRVSALTP